MRSLTAYVLEINSSISYPLLAPLTYRCNCIFNLHPETVTAQILNAKLSIIPFPPSFLHLTTPAFLYWALIFPINSRITASSLEHPLSLKVYLLHHFQLSNALILKLLQRFLCWWDKAQASSSYDPVNSINSKYSPKYFLYPGHSFSPHLPSASTTFPQNLQHWCFCKIFTNLWNS